MVTPVIYVIDGAGTIDGNILEHREDRGPSDTASLPATRQKRCHRRLVSKSYSQHTCRTRPEALLNVTIDGNAVSFSGLDNSATYGIEADAGYGADDLQVLPSTMWWTGFDVGVGWYECTGTCDPGVFTSLAANYNCMENNNTGMESNVSYLTVDGENNWWGDPTGPANPGNPGGLGNPVVGDIDFDPWESSCTSSGNLWQNVTSFGYYASLQDGAGRCRAWRCDSAGRPWPA